MSHLKCHNYANNKSLNRADSPLTGGQHWLCYLLPKLMEKSTLGYSCTPMHHQSVTLKVSPEFFCDEVLFTFLR